MDLGLSLKAHGPPTQPLFGTIGAFCPLCYDSSDACAGRTERTGTTWGPHTTSPTTPEISSPRRDLR